MVNETITLSENVMRFDRLQVPVAMGFLFVVAACAYQIPQENHEAAYAGQSQANVEKAADKPFVSPNSLALTSRDPDDVVTLSDDGRFGMWFNEWGGIELDGLFGQSISDRLNKSVVSATPLLLLRIKSFKSPNLPHGHFQPYFGIGPGFFFTHQKVGLREAGSSMVNTVNMTVGIDLRAGMHWQLSKNLGLFGEYRMTRYGTGGSDRGTARPFFDEKAPANQTTNYLMGGLTLTF